jgi:D-alanyl-D-alanine dipeptidase/carboxypeptidase
MKAISLPNKRIYTGNLILVNSKHSYVSDDKDYLVSVCELSSVLMQRNAVVLLSSLMDKIQGWKNIVPVSGWRSFQEQQKIWDDTLEESGQEFTEKYVAVPGHSEHQTGLAIDLGLKQEKIDFICPAFPYNGICQAFREMASAYGFIERYPAGKEHITGIGHEPWHFRYVGVPHAEFMKKNELTLEEYLSFIKQFPYNQKPLCIQIASQDIQVSYIKAETEDSTKLEVDNTTPFSVSGNNMDGFILTEWRSSYACKKQLRWA